MAQTSLEDCAAIEFVAMHAPDIDVEPVRAAFRALLRSIAVSLALLGRDSAGTEAIVAALMCDSGGLNQIVDIHDMLKADSATLREFADMLLMAEMRLTCGEARHVMRDRDPAGAPCL